MVVRLYQNGVKYYSENFKIIIMIDLFALVLICLKGRTLANLAPYSRTWRQNKVIDACLFEHNITERMVT